MNFITEPERQIPVIYDADVLSVAVGSLGSPQQ